MLMDMFLLSMLGMQYSVDGVGVIFSIDLD